MTEGLYKLPPGWHWARLTEVAEARYGKANPKVKGTVPVVGSGGVYDFTDKPLTETPTLVVGRKGTAGQVWLQEKPCWPSDTTFYLVWKTNEIDIKFPYLFMRLRPLSGENAKTTLPSLSRVDLENFSFPFAPLEEQRRIVAKVEGLMERVREAKRLRTETRREIQTIIDAGRDEILSSLKTIQFGKLVDSYKNGIYKPKQFYGRGYPSVRMFNIQNGQVNIDRTPLLEVTPEELEKYGLEQDDLLINRVNSRELVGKAGIVPHGLGPCTFESKNIRVRVKPDSAVPAFIVEGLNSKIVRRQIWAKLKPAIGQATVNQDDLNQLEIPFISKLNDQRRIVAHLSEIRQKVETLKGAHKKTEIELQRLEQAILDKAFRGEI